jgi:glyoxylase-like metal-dependent hydrolase (beta-lactamase superfamily II)
MISNPSPSKVLTRREMLGFLGLAGGGAFLGGSLLRAADSPVAAKSGAGVVNNAASVGPASLAGPQAGFYRFKIGEFEALSLQDGGMTPPADQSPFGVGEAPGAVAKALDEAMLPAAQVDVPFNVLLVRTKSELVLVDSGCGQNFGPLGGRLLTSLAAAGIRPEQITAVILTHAHGDHFGGLVNAETGRPTFANATHVMSRREHAFWTASAPDVSGMAVPPEGRAGAVAGAQKTLAALKDRWHLVEAGDRLLDGIELIDAPGHTPGHLALMFSSGNEQLLNFADAAHHHAITFARPEWRFAYDADAVLAVATRRRLFDRAAADRLRLWGTHMAFPALGRVRRSGQAYEFVQEPFRLG